MARPELGTKRVCPTTGRKFYDMNRDPIVSPYTGEAFARSTFEPAASSARSAAPPPDEDEDVELETNAAGPEVVSLETVGEAEEAGAEGDTSEDAIIEDDAATDDSFLEEEEEEGGDVSDLIDSDIEDDEES